MNSLMLQKFLLTCAIFRLLNEATDTGKSQPAMHILSIKMKEGGGENKGTEGSASISERGFRFCLHLISQNLVTWPLAARKAGKYGFNPKQP